MISVYKHPYERLDIFLNEYQSRYPYERLDIFLNEYQSRYRS